MTATITFGICEQIRRVLSVCWGVVDLLSIFFVPEILFSLLVLSSNTSNNAEGSWFPTSVDGVPTQTIMIAASFTVNKLPLTKMLF